MTTKRTALRRKGFDLDEFYVGPSFPGPNRKLVVRGDADSLPVYEAVGLATDRELWEIASELTREERLRLLAILREQERPFEEAKIDDAKLMRRPGRHRSPLGSNPVEIQRSENEIRMLYGAAFFSLHSVGYPDKNDRATTVADALATRLARGGQPKDGQKSKVRELVGRALEAPTRTTGARARRVVLAFLDDSGITLTDERVRQIVGPLLTQVCPD